MAFKRFDAESDARPRLGPHREHAEPLHAQVPRGAPDGLRERSRCQGPTSTPSPRQVVHRTTCVRVHPQAVQPVVLLRSHPRQSALRLGSCLNHENRDGRTTQNHPGKEETLTQEEK